VENLSTHVLLDLWLIEVYIVPERRGRILYDTAPPLKEVWDPVIPGHVRAQADEVTRQKLRDHLAGLP